MNPLDLPFALLCMTVSTGIWIACCHLDAKFHNERLNKRADLDGAGVHKGADK